MLYCNLTANGRRTPARTRLDAGHIPEPEDVSLIAEALGIELCVVHSVEAAEIMNQLQATWVPVAGVHGPVAGTKRPTISTASCRVIAAQFYRAATLSTLRYSRFQYLEPSLHVWAWVLSV